MPTDPTRETLAAAITARAAAAHPTITRVTEWVLVTRSIRDTTNPTEYTYSTEISPTCDDLLATAMLHYAADMIDTAE